MLKGQLGHKANNSKPGPTRIPRDSAVDAMHIRKLKFQLEQILEFWQARPQIDGALVSVHYTRVVPKSKRLKALLSDRGNSPSESIRGAKFGWRKALDGRENLKHIFTHYVSLDTIRKAIATLEIVAGVVDRYYCGTITSKEVDELADKKAQFQCSKDISLSRFLNVVSDALFVEKFAVDFASDEVKNDSIVTIFKTGIDTKSLLKKFGINVMPDRILEDTTVRLNPDEVSLLLNQAPYLIAMNVSDLSQLTIDNIFHSEAVEVMGNESFPNPNNEPIVGVIDTQFNEKVYFNNWVEYRNMLSPDIPLEPEDFVHGTAVTSIIVDGPRGNPMLDDGCGNFRVRHFGVATQRPFSSFAIMRMIRDIVATNRDIKVWNLSLGSQLEVNRNFISPEAALLDRIQSEYDVIFVVAGTNMSSNANGENIRLGAPADSINSLVVNSVDFRKNSASYTRVGPVLSFFNKPDLSYYGGDGVDTSGKIVVSINNLGAAYVAGTSFAAPWITRKIAYLIYKMGMTREIAKALIIDAAAGWNRQDDCSHKTGFGIVPIHIDDILKTNDDEIRFMISGVTEKYETYAYNIPIPVVNKGQPFYARATLVYFPHCNRNEGVDYTGTELDLHFGRIQTRNGKARIKTIDDNMQNDDTLSSMYEEDARALYRKWDNVKHISDVIKTRCIPRKVYDYGMWGISIKSKERGNDRHSDTLPFGVVVTLKEMNGVNRIDDFIKLCFAHDWLVERIDVENKLDVYAKAEENIIFE